jgi:CRP-like cAMP-binding protein
MDVDELRGLAVFDGTDDEQLSALLAAGTEQSFRPGEELFRAGEPMTDWWVLLEGRIDLVRKTRREDLVVRTMADAGQWIGAVGAWDPQAVFFLSGRASSGGRILRLPVRALRRMSSTRFPLGDHILEGVVTTLRRVESAINDKEALIGLGTLAAGVVGVSNIMMIAVKERTKEIGVRKALGATPTSVIAMIIQEAVFLTGLAGLLGLVGGVALLEITARVVESEFVKNPSIDLKVGVAATLGLVIAGALAGFFPARAAARVNPISALRDQ